VTSLYPMFTTLQQSTLFTYFFVEFCLVDQFFFDVT